MTLLFIDTAVTEYEKIVAAAQPTVTTVLFDRAVDTFTSLKDKITTVLNGAQAGAVGIVQHGSASAPLYMMLETQATPAIVTDAETSDPTLQSWAELIDFYSFLKENGANTVDLISCALYANAGWVYVLQQLESQLQLNFRASINNTGNISSGGDWIQESDGVNIQDIYFTEDISAYTQLLSGLGYGASVQLVVAPNATIGSYMLKGSTTSNKLMTATSFPENMVVRGTVKGNVISYWGNNGSSGVAFSSSGIVTLFTNSYSTGFMRANGTVFAWGNLNNGGSGRLAERASSGSPVVAITSMGYGTITPSAYAALREDGTVFSWGSTSVTPVAGMIPEASSGSPVVSIASTNTNGNWGAFAALREDGSVYAWGSSENGGSAASAALANSGSPVVSLASSLNSFAALRADGSVYSWGAGAGGSAAFSLMANSGSPVVGISATTTAFAALRADGSVYSWGGFQNNGSGVHAEKANSGSRVISIASNAYAFAALRANGTISVWGDPFNGGGSGQVLTAASSGSPVVGVAGTNPVSVSNSSAFCALRADGSVYAWGSNIYGGSNAQAALANSGSPVIGIYGGPIFAAIRQDGSVYAWGTNTNGGSNFFASQANSGSPVIDLTSFVNGFGALRQNGTVYAWGNPIQGGSNPFPAQTSSSGIISILGGQFMGMTALRSNNPTPASASEALSSDLFGNYIYWSNDSSDTVSVTCRAAIKDSNGTTQVIAKRDFIRTMINRVNGSKYTISSSQLADFKNTLQAGASNLSQTKDIDQYFPTIAPRNNNAFLEISDFVTDNSKYICIELPYNIPTRILENGTTVGYLYYDGTNVRNGQSASSTIINPGESITFGTKTINGIAVGSLVGSGGPAATNPPAAPIPQPARPTVRDGTIAYYWNKTDTSTTGFTLTLTGGQTPIIVNLSPTTYEYTFSSGLENGTTYTATLVATNSAGNSPTVTYQPAELCSPPSAPQDVNFTKVGPDAVQITWTAPGSLNGGPIQGYALYDYNNRSSRTTRYGIEAYKNLHVQTGIPPGTYTWAFVSFNASGYGATFVNGVQMSFP